MWLLTLKSVLVATDLGGASGPALRTAARLAPLAGAKLHLLHVADELTPEGEARLRGELARAMPGAPEPASVLVGLGDPAAAIVERAAQVAADVIILGPHRRGSGDGGEMGSTAASVVRSAPCPCLVAATELRLPLERVMAPVDLSEVAGGALSVAVSWASALRPRGGQAQLTALRVAPASATSAADEEVRAEVERARAHAGGAAQVEIRAEVARGSGPAEEILRRAAAESADLLVMGTHGAARAASGFGSVSAAVVRDTPCPVLLVPPVVWKEHEAELP